MTRLFTTLRGSAAQLLAGGLLLLAAACSDTDKDGAKPVANISDAGAKEDASANDDAESTAPTTAIIYALMIRNPESFTDYIMAGKELPSGTIDTSRGIELPGGNYYSDDSALYYNNFETNTLQRYVVNRSLDVQLDGEISLANYIGCTPVFFSAERAFCIAPDDGLVIEFDPTAMEIKREVEVPELIRKGFSGGLNRAERVGNRILGSIVYTDEELAKTAEDSTIAVAIDADSDHPLTVLHDERAASTDNGFVDDDGNFYVLAEATGGYFSLVEGQDVPPRLLRVKRDADKVDPDYMLDLGELFDTKAVNGLWPLKDKKFVLQVWRGSDDASTADDLDVKPNWEWYIVDAETKEKTQISELGRSTTSYSLLRFVVDKQLYLQQYVVPDENYNAAHMELYKVAEAGTAEKVLESTRGDLRSMVRVRVKISD